MLNSPIPFLIEALNERWCVLYLEDDSLNKPSTISLMLTLCPSIPVFKFSDAEDHGWGYRIFADGREQANFYNDYYMDHRMVVELAEARYPNIDVQPFLYGESEGQRVFRLLLEEVKQSRDYQVAYAKQFQNKHVEAFAHFGVDLDTINALDQIISPDGLQSEPPRRKEVKMFKKYLGILEMAWKSYHYLMLDKDRGK
jgi:hypothetical protein